MYVIHEIFRKSTGKRGKRNAWKRVQKAKAGHIENTVFYIREKTKNTLTFFRKPLAILSRVVYTTKACVRR